MQNPDLDKNNSFIRSRDVLQNNAAELVSIPQIADGATELAEIIEDIFDAMGAGAEDLTGYTIDKANLRQALTTVFTKVTRSAAALYETTNNNSKLHKVDFLPSEITRMRDSEFYATASRAHNAILPDAALLIGSSPADVTALGVAKEAFNDFLQAPKEAISNAQKENEKIKPLIKKGDALRKKINTYMLTFEDDKPDIYNEWRLSLSIDNTGGTATPDLSTPPISCSGGGLFTPIDYAPITASFSGATKIKFFLPDPLAQGVSVGFGPDPTTISSGSELMLSAGANPRVSAASLGYDLNATRFLNIRNATPGAVSVTVEFYLED